MGGVIQVAIAVAIGLAILAVGLWAIRLLATPAGGEQDPEEVIDVEIAYRCSVCGLRLTVTHARGEGFRPPRHCREEMEPLP